MSAVGRWVMLAAAGLLLALGLVLGLRPITYSAYPEDDQECGSVLSPTTFIVSEADDPLVDEAARCAGEMSQAAAPVWSMLVGGAVLVVVAVAGGRTGGGRGAPGRVEGAGGVGGVS